jgi:hypothetical protein
MLAERLPGRVPGTVAVWRALDYTTPGKPPGGLTAQGAVQGAWLLPLGPYAAARGSVRAFPSAAPPPPTARWGGGEGRGGR